MKAVIFAGGFGTRLSEETALRPKPMVEVAGRPILWHVMKIYARHGITDFVVLGGYKIEVIRQYFLSYTQLMSDFTIDLVRIPTASTRHSEMTSAGASGLAACKLWR